MREPRVAISVVVVLWDSAAFSGDKRGRDLAVRTRNGLLYARRHGQPKLFDIGVEAILESRRTGRLRDLGRAVGKSDAADPLEIGPAREVVSVRQGGLGWWSYHRVCRDKSAGYRCFDRFRAHQGEPHTVWNCRTIASEAG